MEKLKIHLDLDKIISFSKEPKPLSKKTEARNHRKAENKVLLFITLIINLSLESEYK